MIDSRPVPRPIHMLNVILRLLLRAYLRLVYLAHRARGGNGIEAINRRLLRTEGIENILRQFGATIGEPVAIHGPIFVHNATPDYSNLRIGDNVHIGRAVLLDLTDVIVIEDNATVSMRTNVLTHASVGHRPLERDFPPKQQATRVGAGSYIGATATILAGCHVGEGAVVAAGGVVTRPVAPRTVVGGVPATPIRMLGDQIEPDLGIQEDAQDGAAVTSKDGNGTGNHARRRSLRRTVRRALDALAPGYRFSPQRYWERRAAEMITTYDNPEVWDKKRWVRAGVEEAVVPDLLRNAGVRSVVVAGAGCGREYGYLRQHDFEVRGFDISPSMVAAARERFPQIATAVDTVVKADLRQQPADAVVTSCVLTHVPPNEIEAAVESLKKLAGRILITREKTMFTERSHYQWAHDYSSLLAGWRCIHREITDEDEASRVELMAWERLD